MPSLRWEVQPQGPGTTEVFLELPWDAEAAARGQVHGDGKHGINERSFMCVCPESG